MNFFRIKKHYEDLIDKKEKDVRQELTNTFMKMYNKDCDDFEIRLKNDRKIHADTHNWEVTLIFLIRYYENFQDLLFDIHHFR